MYSMNSETFEGNQNAFRLFLLFGFLHVAFIGATFYSFMQIRVPVIRYMRTRKYVTFETRVRF